MRKNPALFFLIVSIFFILSFTFPKHSFAVARLYQCSPVNGYYLGGELAVECDSTSQLLIDCMTPQGTNAQLTSGQECADNAAIWYGGQEGITLEGRCIEKCSTTGSDPVCPRDSHNTCIDMDLATCTETTNPASEGVTAICIEYTEVAPTPTPIPTIPPPPTPTPTNTPTPTIPPPPTPTSIPTPTPTSGPCPGVSGFVWIDDGRGVGTADNGARDGTEPLYTLSTLTITAISSNPRVATTDTGSYSLVNLCGPPYDIALTVPSGYRTSTFVSNPVFGVFPPSTINYGILPLAGPTPTPTVGAPTPTPNCGVYTRYNGGPLSCQGYWECNQCGQCREVGGSPNSCEASGYVCVNQWIPFGGFPRTCDVLDLEGIVYIDTNLNGVKDSGEPNYTGNWVYTCGPGIDVYGNPICRYTGGGGATIRVARPVFVCDAYGGTDVYGNPICIASHYESGAGGGTTTNQSGGDYRASPLQRGDYLVTITPPLGSVGTGVTIRSFARPCPDPTSSPPRNCGYWFPPGQPTNSITNPFDRVLSTTSAFIRLPPSPFLPVDTSWTLVDFGISPPSGALTPTPTPTPTPIGPTFIPTPTAAPGCTNILPGKLIRESVFENCAIDVGETGFNGASVALSGGRVAVTAGNGDYSFANLCAGVYTATLSIPAGYRMSSCSSSSITTPPIPPSTPVNFFIVPAVPTPTPTPIPTYTITGRVFVDTNENQAQDAGELGFAGATVRAVGPTTGSAVTNGSAFPIPNFTIANLTAGSYTVSLSPVPAGYFVTTNYPVSRTLGPNATVYIGIAPMHSISGNVYVDTNGNKIKDAGEANYTLGSSTIQVRTGSNCSGSLRTTLNTPNGTFTTGNILPTGQYTLCYANIPLGYIMTFPRGQVGLPHIILGVGSPCTAFPFDSVTVGTCDVNGNISNANFGINFANPWFSSRGVDLRVDDGFDDPNIPTSAIPPYASLDGTGGMPGVIFSGNENADFGPFGQASSRRWVVGNSLFPEVYTPPILNTIKTSFDYLSAIARKNALTPLDLNSGARCGGGGSISNCTLNLPNDPGLFIANGNLTIVNLSYTIPSNQDYVILVNGDLTLRGEIHVPIGSTVTFSAKGDIIVDRTVGSPASSATPDLEGLYSADRNFITGGNDDCAIGPDLRLNIAGTIVTNASLLGGTLQKQRDLCAGNVSNPAVFITERPDFVLNSPLFIQSTQTIWQEVAP